MQFKKADVPVPIQEIFKELFDKVHDSATMSITQVNDTEMVFSSDPHLIPLYYLTINDVKTAQEYL